MTTLAACRPVTWTPAAMGMTEWPKDLSTEEPYIYPGSIIQPCVGTACGGQDIHVGPRVQAAIASGLVDRVVCFWCAAVETRDQGATLGHLGNPHDPEGRFKHP